MEALRASAGAWTTVVCESVWVGGAWKGDIAIVLTLLTDPAPYGPQRNAGDPRLEEGTRKEGKSLTNYNLIKFISRWTEFSKSWC